MKRKKIGNAEGFESKKKLRKQVKIGRIQNTESERNLLIIACEDKKSSRLYFQAIFDDLARDRVLASRSCVIAKHNNTHPCGVLQDLLDHKDHETFDHKWIVIDRDEKRIRKGEVGGWTEEQFEQARADASKNKVDVAYSNPCFEIWVLLHFQYYEEQIDRYDLEKLLESTYHYTKSKLFLPMFNPELQKNASDNATKLMNWRKGQGLNPATDNPSTTVHKLVALLNGFRKKEEK
jgi:hypothetical protein